MSEPNYIASNHLPRGLCVAVAIVAALLCMGFDRAEVSEARDSVLDEDYQTELPEFTDAEPESPFDFLDDEKKCDPKEDPNCEGEKRSGHTEGDGETGSGGGDAETGSEGSSGESGSGDGSGPGDANGSGGKSGSGDSDGSGTESGSGASGSGAGAGDGPGNFWDHEAELDPPDPPEPPDWDIPKGLLTVLQVLGIAVLSVILLLIIWRISIALSNRSDTAEAEETSGPEDTAGALRQNAPTRPHAELASEAHHDEAIHRLLLETIDILAERQSGLSSPSLTARELLRRVRLDDETHRHLTALVRAVEEILFAQRPADTEKYEQSLEHYREIMRALGRGSV